MILGPTDDGTKQGTHCESRHGGTSLFLSHEIRDRATAVRERTGAEDTGKEAERNERRHVGRFGASNEEH